MNDIEQFFPTPWRFDETGHVGGPCVKDANGSVICAFFWPMHPAEDTERAEKATYEFGNTVAALQKLILENWQLKGALGYPVPGDIPSGAFKCGMCAARAVASDERDAPQLREPFKNAAAADWDYIERLLVCSVRSQEDSATRFWLEALKAARVAFTVNPSPRE